jgi:hypothetical protein
MMNNWRTGQSADITAVLDGLGGDWRAKFDRNEALSPVTLRAFLAALGLVEEGAVSYTPSGLARLVEQVGPLFEVGDDSVENNQVSHVRIITGVQGDGTPDGTTVTLVDSSGGTVTVETFSRFDARHGAVDPVATGLGVFHH